MLPSAATAHVPWGCSVKPGGFPMPRAGFWYGGPQFGGRSIIVGPSNGNLFLQPTGGRSARDAWAGQFFCLMWDSSAPPETSGWISPDSPFPDLHRQGWQCLRSLRCVVWTAGVGWTDSASAAVATRDPTEQKCRHVRACFDPRASRSNEPTATPAARRHWGLVRVRGSGIKRRVAGFRWEQLGAREIVAILLACRADTVFDARDVLKSEARSPRQATVVGACQREPVDESARCREQRAISQGQSHREERQRACREGLTTIVGAKRRRHGGGRPTWRVWWSPPRTGFRPGDARNPTAILPSPPEESSRSRHRRA